MGAGDPFGASCRAFFFGRLQISENDFGGEGRESVLQSLALIISQ